MIKKIENKIIQCQINIEEGQAISLIKENNEYLYQRDEEWKKTTPLMFPSIGLTKNNIWEINNRRYPAFKHGFIQKLKWKLIEKTDKKIVLEPINHLKFLKYFPFKYQMKQIFELQDNQLLHQIEITNTDDKDIYYKFGFHPGFKFNKGDVSFDFQEMIFHVDENSYLELSEPPMELEKFNLSDLNFNHYETFIIDSLNSKQIKLDNLTLKTNAPCLGIWKPTNNSKFVCIEPWYGTPSRNVDHDCLKIEEHYKIEKLSINETKIYQLIIEIN